MKKKILLLLSVVLAVTMLFAGCSGDKGSNSDVSSQPDNDSSLSSTVSPEPEESAEPESKVNGSELVQAFVDGLQSEIEAYEKEAAGVFVIEIVARGESIIYRYTLTADMVEDIDALRDGLEEGMEAQKESLVPAVDFLRAAGVENPSVIMEYLNVDGTEIYSIEVK